MRVKTTKVGRHASAGLDRAPPCLWDDYPPWPESYGSSSPGYNQEGWFWAQNPCLPEGRPYDGELEKVKKTVSLNGKTIQCIVKLANIVLTPENPEYPGGKWHVEGQPLPLSLFESCAERLLGMLNERIVSSFIYVSVKRQSLWFTRFWFAYRLSPVLRFRKHHESKLAFRRSTS